MSTDMMKSESASPRISRALIVADALQQEADQRKLLGQYIHGHMIEGTDYGIIPGTKVKTLLKPGAEKLTQLYRCIPRFVIEEKIENWDTALFYYRFSCQIVTQADDAVVAEGVGSCSTYESRYRWRSTGRKCPACGAEAIIKGKAEYGGGWICFKKKDGCGAKFSDDDPDITDQPTGRVQNPDLLDQVNTVLKMAKKRALVDAAIALARCSDIFTQDVEDMLPAEPDRPASSPAKPAPTVNLAELYAQEIPAAASEEQLRAVVDRLNADRKQIDSASFQKLGGMVKARKSELAKPAAPVPEAETIPLDSEPVEDADVEPAAPPTMPGAERRTAPPTTPADGVPTAGKAIIEAILGQLHELGVNWAQVRDGVEKGEEIAAAAALPKMPVDFRIQQLSAVEAGRLHAELKSRLEKKRAAAEKRAANKAAKAEGAAS